MVEKYFESKSLFGFINSLARPWLFPHGKSLRNGVKFSVQINSFGIEENLKWVELYWREMIENFGFIVVGFLSKLTDKPNKPEIARVLCNQFTSILKFIFQSLSLKKSSLYFIKKKKNYCFSGICSLKMAQSSRPIGALAPGKPHSL